MMPKGTIMILGAGEGQLPIIRRAKDAGWHTIVVSPQGDYPGFSLADSCRYIDISDKEAVLEVAILDGITAIATDQTDIAVPTVLYVAEKLKLQHILCDCIDNFRMKSSMREICYKNGFSLIPFCVTCEIERAISFYYSLNNRIAIVKPVDSQGSRGVQKVSSLEELEGAFVEAKKYSASGLIIVEQFLVGQEIEVDTVIRDGRVICTLIGDVYNFDVKNTFSAYVREYPSLLPQVIQDKICTLNYKVLNAFGLNTGWTHGEYIYSQDYDEVFLLEIGARGGGCFIGSEIVREMIGVGTDEMAFCTAIGDDSFYDRISPRNSFCAYRCFYLPEGEIISINITNNILEKPFVIAHNLNHLHVGMKTRKNVDKTSRNSIVIKERSRELLRQRLMEVEQSISIQVKTTNGIQGIIWK